MIPNDPQPTPSPSGREPSHRDRLIARVAGGDLTAAAWTQWSRHATDDCVAWRAMAESLRDQLSLVGMLEPSLDAADTIDLPDHADETIRAGRVRQAVAAMPPSEDRAAGAAEATDVAAAATSAATASAQGIAHRRPDHHDEHGGHGGHDEHGGPHHRPVLARIGAAGGWMAAAVLLLSMLIDGTGLLPSRERPTTDGPNTATAGLAVPDLSADDALDLYLERGREEGVVLEQAPARVLIDSRPVADGSGYEVILIRQIYEREIVPELYMDQGTDASGQRRYQRLAAYTRTPM